MQTHLKNVSPLSVRGARPHVLLKVQACLCFWEIPNHLSLEDFTAQFCRCNRTVSVRNKVSILKRSQDTHYESAR